MYGRRGTGKTHALLYLNDLLDGTGDVAVYLDLRTIGSAGGMYADSTRSPAVRGTHLLVDTLEAVHDELLTVAVERDVTDPTLLLSSLDALAAAATEVKVVGEVAAETRRNAFAELVGAAQCLPRDAINIAALAAQHAHDEPISIGDVRRAARDWYLRDKQTAIGTNDGARETLRALVDEVVGHRRARTFVVNQLAAQRNGTIEDLHDARLLHLLRRGIADPRYPGTLYDGFAIDYGCYVTLLMDDPKFHVRDRGDWLNNPKGVPPEGFNLAKVAIDPGVL